MLVAAIVEDALNTDQNVHKETVRCEQNVVQRHRNLAALELSVVGLFEAGNGAQADVVDRVGQVAGGVESDKVEVETSDTFAVKVTVRKGERRILVLCFVYDWLSIDARPLRGPTGTHWDPLIEFENSALT